MQIVYTYWWLLHEWTFIQLCHPSDITILNRIFNECKSCEKSSWHNEIKIHKQIWYYITPKNRMNNKITAQILNKELFNQKLDKHIPTSVFSLHFLSQFKNKILPIELMTIVHLYHQYLKFRRCINLQFFKSSICPCARAVYFSELP